MKTLLWDESKGDWKDTKGWIAVSDSDTIEIIGVDGNVHYRRPYGHPDILVALKTEGVTIRIEKK